MAMLGQTPACTPDIVCHHPLFFFSYGTCVGLFIQVFVFTGWEYICASVLSHFASIPSACSPVLPRD